MAPQQNPSRAGSAIGSAGVHHVSLMVDDLDGAVDFYTRVLGLTRRTDRPDDVLGPGAWLDTGVQQLHLIPGAVPDARGQHFAFAVADLDAAVAALRAAGVTVSDPTPVGPARQSFLKDPSGNAIELNQPA